MRRDTKIVLSVVAAIPTVILSVAALCSWALAHGASEAWRLPFRLLCHGLPHRSFELFDVAMPLCARCVGVYVGLLAGLALFPLLSKLQERVMRTGALVAVLPLAIDGLTQLTGLRESTNELRVMTGLLAGLAFGLWVLSAVERRDDTALAAP